MTSPDDLLHHAARPLPPVDRWQPAETIDSQMRIDAAGHWFYQDSPIQRPAMVRAFSTLLLRDADGQHWLMTPQCRQSIAVQDAAFMAVDVVQEGAVLVFRLNTGDRIEAGPDHPLRAAGTAAAPALYLAVRHGCEARLDRATWLQLADLAEEAVDGSFHVTSHGMRFALEPA
ncbi:proteophosphoglycan [Croceibacterium mercuriale]|uniref:Proteophosphoglycan n=1 Tax=Croceibacterium mercuriale TaxID=1572751 RepID=A0A0B2BZ01_9SPHN|nr:DUF1285 domain-containing protein [Croceibacterium mercuriale]KHL26813.1 proteophosphoglycan [Croceibacterium mercuriale]